jgi:hypothetical protein
LIGLIEGSIYLILKDKSVQANSSAADNKRICSIVVRQPSPGGLPLEIAQNLNLAVYNVTIKITLFCLLYY